MKVSSAFITLFVCVYHVNRCKLSRRSSGESREDGPNCNTPQPRRTVSCTIAPKKATAVKQKKRRETLTFDTMARRDEKMIACRRPAVGAWLQWNGFHLPEKVVSGPPQVCPDSIMVSQEMTSNYSHRRIWLLRAFQIPETTHSAT